MNKEEVIDLLESQKDERGIAYWEKSGYKGLKSYGLGVTKLKKIGKQIGRDHELALELWNMPVYDTKILATVIAKPKELTREQIDEHIKETDFWLLSHCYCNYLLPKLPFINELAETWTKSTDNLLKRCGYLLVHTIAKDDKKKADPYFERYIDVIESSLQSEVNFVRDAMNNALFMIGQRNKKLNTRAIEAAKNIGKVEVDYGDNSCQARDCVKHLTGDRVQSRFSG